MENSKKLHCKYDATKKANTPWDCKVCRCISDKGKTRWGTEIDEIEGEHILCKNIPPSRAIFSVYPELLSLFGDIYNTTELVVGDVDVIRDDYNENILCGEKKDATLKLTADGNPLLIKKPKDVPNTIQKHPPSYNPKLWAKDILVAPSWDKEFQILEELKDENTSNFTEVKDYYSGERRGERVNPIYKDDWSDEYEGIPVVGGKNPYPSSFTKDMPPKYWTYTDFLREWVSNAFDVTPGGKVEFYVDDHGSIVLDYESDSPLLPKYLCILGTHVERKGSIGIFGEGLKQATVGFTAQNKMMKIETIGWTYYPVFKYDSVSEEYIMHTWNISPNDRTKGTKVTILNVEDPDGVMQKTKEVFLKWRNPEILYDDGKGNQILGLWPGDPVNSNCVSVRGVRTDVIENPDETPMLYNYNLFNNALMNRDRKFVETFPTKHTSYSKILARMNGA